MAELSRAVADRRMARCASGLLRLGQRRRFRPAVAQSSNSTVCTMGTPAPVADLHHAANIASGDHICVQSADRRNLAFFQGSWRFLAAAGVGPGRAAAQVAVGGLSNLEPAWRNRSLG